MIHKGLLRHSIQSYFEISFIVFLFFSQNHLLCFIINIIVIIFIIYFCTSKA